MTRAVVHKKQQELKHPRCTSTQPQNPPCPSNKGTLYQSCGEPIHPLGSSPQAARRLLGMDCYTKLQLTECVRPYHLERHRWHRVQIATIVWQIATIVPCSAEEHKRAADVLQASAKRIKRVAVGRRGRAITGPSKRGQDPLLRFVVFSLRNQVVTQQATQLLQLSTSRHRAFKGQGATQSPSLQSGSGSRTQATTIPHCVRWWIAF